MSRNVHLVGSIPLRDAEEVFVQTSEILGDGLRRVPDGETGERLSWIFWLEPLFKESAFFTRSEESFRLHAGAPEMRRYRLADGVSIEDVKFDNLFYADYAKDSYEVFRGLRDSGRIGADLRFQVAIAPAHSVLWLFAVEELHAELDTIYNAALVREINKICDAIPVGDIAIQIDVASAVFARLHREDTGPYGATKTELMDSFVEIIADLGKAVPAGAELLIHLCYGDAGHRHVVEPDSTADMVHFSNRLIKSVPRTIDLIHMPVPRDRDDPEYFEPLRSLDRQNDTELSLGLIHYTDGLEGAKRRIETATKTVTGFGVATECGFGRRDPSTVIDLLTLHAEVASLN